MSDKKIISELLVAHTEHKNIEEFISHIDQKWMEIREKLIKKYKDSKK